MNKTRLLAVATLGSAGLFACAAPTDPAAPDAVADDLGTESITSTGGKWTLTPNAPQQATDGTVRASVTITGTSGSTDGGGVCLLQRIGTACTPSGSTDVATDQAWLSQSSQCGAKPVSNGYWYCIKSGSDTSPTCAFRRGDRTQMCAGSPTRIALGQSATWALPSSSYNLATPLVSVPVGAYFSYACGSTCEAGDLDIAPSPVINTSPYVTTCGGKPCFKT